MAKAKSYKLQGREWTVKDLAEELGLSTPRVHGLLKEHNEDIKAIFASRGITPKPADKGPKARLFDYKGKQWTVKQLAEEFGLSNVRVNRLIKEFDGDIEKIALSREKSKKTAETEKAPEEDNTDSSSYSFSDEEINFAIEASWMKDVKRYLCLSYEDYDDDDYKHRFRITDSEQIFQEIKTYFIEMYERIDSSDVLLTIYENDEFIEIGTIDSYMDDKELTSKNLGINECEDVFGLSRKNDLKNVSYFGLDLINEDYNLECILDRISGKTIINKSLTVLISYDHPDDGAPVDLNQDKIEINSLKDFENLCKKISEFVKNNNFYSMFNEIQLSSYPNEFYSYFSFYKEDICLGTVGSFNSDNHEVFFDKDPEDCGLSQTDLDLKYVLRLDNDFEFSMRSYITGLIGLGSTWNYK